MKKAFIILCTLSLMSVFCLAEVTPTAPETKKETVPVTQKKTTIKKKTKKTTKPVQQTPQVSTTTVTMQK
jgi:hypothetical protein